MKGLILKDMINLKSQFRIYVIIMVLWFVLGMVNESAVFFSGVMVMFVIMLPMTTMAYDDKVKWNSYALAMPISRMDLVLSKYLLMYVELIVVAALSLLGCFIISHDMADSFVMTLSILPVGLIMNAILMPIIFKFGVEKGRFIFIAMAVAFSVIVVLADKYADFDNLKSILAIGEIGLIIILFAVAVAITVVSVAVSAKIYREKDF